MGNKIKTAKKIFSFCLLLLCSSVLFAQNCQNYDAKCNLTDNSFTRGSISQGLKIVNGQFVSVACIFYEGKENYISLCGEFDVGEISIKILNALTKEVLYDNTEDKNKQNMSIRVEVTTKVILQISAPNAKYSFSDGKCIGLLIAYKSIEK